MSSEPKTANSPSVARRWPVWLLAVLVTLGFPTLFSGGYCTYHSDDCDDWDDDDDFDDDDCDWDDDDRGDGSGTRLRRGANDPYRLVKFEQVSSHTPGAHPVAWLRHIEGISLFHPGSPASYEEADFEMFTGLLILVNKSLLGLPPSAGLLTFVGVDFQESDTEEGESWQDGGMQVRWRQETLQPDGTWQPVPDTALVFYFDAVGNLVTVQNRTWLRPAQR